MKTSLIISLLIFISCIAAAQQPATADTTRRKADTSLAAPASQPQPTVKTEPATTSQPRQRKDTRPLIKRFEVDFNTGFWANSTQATGEVMVTVAYKFPKILSIGAGPTYVFSYNRQVDKNLNGWGGKIFTRAQLLKFIYLWTEYQGLSNQYISDFNPVTKSKAYSDSWFWGAGINFFGINLSVMYDILHDSRSAYAGATIYRIGYSF